MADELPPAIQDFIADVDQYIEPLERAMEKLAEFIAMNEEAAKSALDMGRDVTAAADVAAQAEKELAGAAQTVAAAETQVAAGASAASHALDEEARVAAAVAAAIDAAAAAARELTAADLEAAAAAEVLAAAERELAAQRAADVRGARDAIGTLASLAQEEYRLGASMAVVEDAAAQAANELDDLAVANSRVVMASKEAGAAARDAALELAAGAETADAAVGRAVSAALRLTAAEITASDAAETLRNKITEATGAMILEANQAKVLAEADAILAAGEGLAAHAAEVHKTAIADATAGMDKATIASLGLAKAAADTGKAAGAATGFWARWGQVIHWVVAGGVEFLATAVPAVVAFGAAMLVGMQGAQMMQQHLQSLYTATEATANMFHVTFGQALGLKSVLQQAQDAANPHVYQLLGAALGIMKSQAGGFVQAGSKVIGFLDQFAAKLQFDFSKAGGAGQTMNTLFKAMVPDLVMFGQVLGNIGHAIALFASKMPGLAEVLLKILDAFSGVLLWVSKLPTPLIMTAMAMEEIWRWGTPLAAILTRLPGMLAAFAASGFGVAPVALRIAEVFRALAGFIPNLIARFSEIIAVMAPSGSVFERAALAVNGFSERLAVAIAEMTVFDALAGTALIAAMVAVGIALTRTRSATQQYVDSMNRAVQAASQLKVLDTLGAAIGGATARISAQEQVLRQYPSALDRVASSNAKWTQQLRGMEGPLAGAGQGAQNLGDKINSMAGRVIAAIPGVGALGHAYASLFGASHAAAAVQQLTAAQEQWVRQSVNVVQGAAAISHEYGVNFVGALAMAQQAGVKLQDGYTGMSQAAQIARLQVADLVAGYQAMGQSGTAVAGDMEVLAVQSGLAGTQVQKLTQAMQQYMQEVTGGTSALAGYVTSIGNLGTVVGKARTGIGNLGSGTTIALGSVSKFAAALKNMSGQGAQAWTNFDQVMGQTLPQLIGWFQTAGAMGVLSGQKMKQGMLDALSGVVPYAQGNKAAEASVLALARQNLGTSLTWAQLTAKIKETHASMKDANKVVQDTTVKMGDLMQVAQNLGNVMSTSIIQTMDQAKLAASGLAQEASTLASDLAKPSVPASKLNTDIGNIYNTVMKLTGSKSAAETTTRAYADSFGKAGKAAYDAWQKVHTDAPKIPKAMVDAANQGKGPVTSAFHGLAVGAYNGVQSENLPGKMKTTGTQAGQGMHTGLMSQLGAIGHWGASVYDYLNRSLNALPGQLAHLGLMAAEGLAHGLASGIGAIISAAASLASAIPSSISKLLHMGSPSRVTMQQGQWAAEGLAIGITNGLPGVLRAAHQLADVVPGGLAIGTNGVPLAWEAEKIGKDTIRQLIKGLTGNLSQVKKAMTDIMTTLHKAIADGMAHGDMSALQRRHDLMLAVTLGQDNKKLQALANERQKIMNQIKKAEQYAASVTSSIRGEAGLGNLTQPTDPKTGNPLPWTPDSIQSGLTGQLNKMKAFDHNIDVLKKMHLDKHLIAQIVAMGYQQGGAMAEALAHESEAQIKALNKTEKAILAVSKKIGKDAADAMYDSGKNAGKGFLAGLKSQEKAIEHEMRRIADIIVKAIRKALRSKSPSMEMHDVGMDAAHGLALGLADGTPMVLAAAAKMAAAVAKVKVHVPSPVTGGHLMLPPLRGGGPGGGAPVVIVHQHIAGSVLAEQQLQQYMQTGVLKYTHRNSGNGMYLPGRASGAPVR